MDDNNFQSMGQQPGEEDIAFMTRTLEAQKKLIPDDQQEDLSKCIGEIQGVMSKYPGQIADIALGACGLLNAIKFAKLIQIRQELGPVLDEIVDSVDTSTEN